MFARVAKLADIAHLPVWRIFAYLFVGHPHIGKRSLIVSLRMALKAAVLVCVRNV